MSATLLAAEVEKNGKWLVYDFNEVIWGTVAFLIIAGLLWWKAGSAIKRAMEGYTARVQSELDQAAEERRAAEASRDDIKTALADSDSEAARILEEARQVAEQVTASVAARTEADIEGLRARAVTDLEATRRQATADLAAEVSRLSLGAAERVVEHALDEATHEALIDAYIARVGSSN